MQTGVLPPFVPFAQALAAVLTAVLTGSLYYVAASPKGNFFLYPTSHFFFSCSLFFLVFSQPD